MGLRLFTSFGMTGAMTALGIVLGTGAAAAQQTAPATTNQATPAPAPTPTPTPGSIGNPALENFNLNGTVTREATPAPAPSQPPAARPAPTRDAPTVTNSGNARAPVATTTRDAAPSAPSRESAPRTAPDSSPVVSTPDATATSTLPSEPAPDLMPPAPVEPAGGSLWPWLLALALALGGGFWWWRRQQEGAGELAFAGPAPDVSAPAPVPQPVPAPSPRAPSLDGGIVARTLQPKLAFELRPLKFETDDKQSARLTFELVVANVGSAPARDIRIEAKMFNAGPEQDREIVSFFRSPGAMGAKLPPIAPQDRVPLRSRIGMTAADYQALTMGGRSLVIPMIAVNAVYRGSAGETQDSASWLVGALPSGGDAEKLRPFPLDKPVATTALAARTHSGGIAA